jgi:hypothetical protein
MSEADHAEHRRNYFTVVAGDVAVGFGVGGFIALVAGLGLGAEAQRTVDREGVRDEPNEVVLARARRNRSTAQALTIAGGISAGVLVSAGIALIAVGTRRETKRRARAEAAQAVVWPVLQPVVQSGGTGRHAGVQLRVRF